MKMFFRYALKLLILMLACSACLDDSSRSRDAVSLEVVDQHLRPDSLDPERTQVGESEDTFILATHYFGFGEYDWPVGYLTSIDQDRVIYDPEYLRELGFNTIVLVAGWADLEPEIGRPSVEAYEVLGGIIAAANEVGLDVFVRIPYPHSNNAVANIDNRAVRIILNHRTDPEWYSFIYWFRGWVDDYSNVRGIFASWEDFRHIEYTFFGDFENSAELRKMFTDYTGLSAESVVRNGDGYREFLNWQDSLLMDFQAHMAEVFGEFSFEVRVDDDPVFTDNGTDWVDHGSTFNFDGDAILYWAPYYGAPNQGDALTAEAAHRSFKWMLDKFELIAGSNRSYWVDQLNFIDNTRGTERNSYIDTEEVDEFF